MDYNEDRSGIAARLRKVFHVFLMFMMWLLPATAWSAELSDLPRLYVQPDKEILVAISKEKITLDSASSDDVKLTTDAPGGQAKLWVITFMAPSTKSAGEVSVNYTVGAAKHSVVIQVSATPQPDSATLASAATTLGQMLVIAIVMESAFAVIFNWRVFLEFFDGRGVRTLVMFIGGWIVAHGMHQDFVGSLFDIYLRPSGGSDQYSTWSTQVLTALVLAGGSASVNQLFVALNLREVKTSESVTEKVPPNKAWIAIKIMNIDKGDKITVVDASNGQAANASTEHLVGIIPGAGVGERLKKYFWRDRNRLPMSQGFVVDPDKEYAFVIRRTKQNNGTTQTTSFDLAGTPLNPIPPIGGAKADGLGDLGAVPVSQLTPAPRRYSFAKGAVVDFRVTLS